MKHITAFLAPALALAFCAAARAAVVKGDREYKADGVLMQGYAAYESGGEKRPGVLVIHEWWGINPYIKSRVDQLAALGYVAFAADIYGKGARAADAAEAGRLAGIYRADRGLMRARAAAALAELKKLPGVDPKRVAVIGYCFGGGAALELARSGAELAGAVSFHGGLNTPRPSDAGNIKGKVLVLHGGDDPHVPAAEVAAFQKEMREGGVDWQLNVYGGAVHAFSNPGAGGDPSKGSAYDEKADRRSWKAMRAFFEEIFAR